MKIDFSTVLHSLAGDPLNVQEGDKLRPMTLADAAVGGLMNPTGEAETGDVKFALFKLAERVHQGGVVELEPEDVALIKKRIGASYAVAVVGPAYRLLNGA